MPTRKSAADALRPLLDEVHSIEALLTDMAPASDQIQEYWQLSLDLVDLVMRIEGFAAEPGATTASPGYQPLRSDLTRLESRIIQLEQDVGQG